MKPFSKLLLPVDFSTHSEHALEVAADLAQRYGARLCIAHVYEPALYATPDAFLPYGERQLAHMIAEYQKLLDKRALDARTLGAMQVETKLLQGVPVTEIVGFAKEWGCDLIVMGTHGRTGLAHALIGSVAERIVRSAHCPVMTVRAHSNK